MQFSYAFTLKENEWNFFVLEGRIFMLCTLNHFRVNQSIAFFVCTLAQLQLYFSPIQLLCFNTSLSLIYCSNWFVEFCSVIRIVFFITFCLGVLDLNSRNLFSIAAPFWNARKRFTALLVRIFVNASRGLFPSYSIYLKRNIHMSLLP